MSFYTCRWKISCFYFAGAGAGSGPPRSTLAKLTFLQTDTTDWFFNLKWQTCKIGRYGRGCCTKQTLLGLMTGCHGGEGLTPRRRWSCHTASKSCVTNAFRNNELLAEFRDENTERLFFFVVFTKNPSTNRKVSLETRHILAHWRWTKHLFLSWAKQSFFGANCQPLI